MKSVQIPYDLFVALVEYHLAYDDDYAGEIRQGLEQKLDALVRHELYAKYKTAPTPEEREQARQALAGLIAAPGSFETLWSQWADENEALCGAYTERVNAWAGQQGIRP